MRHLLPAFLITLLLARTGFADLTLVSEALPAGFSLVGNHEAAPIYVDQHDARVVTIAANGLADDIEAVTSLRPQVTQTLSDRCVIVGTIGSCPPIDDLIQSGKLRIDDIKGQWESFVIAPVDGHLIVAGSDRRGTAYGAFSLSEHCGVSGWRWWADVAPAHRDSITLTGSYSHGPPSVKYRGLFINDEDWSMHPWASQTFELENMDMGPRTYAKLFELILRLKGNCCWPAMHNVTRAFNADPRNRQVADDYAIVMGASHCEPLLRNNVGEWVVAQNGPWNYVTNQKGVDDYWRERLVENGKFDNFYTIGMRGIHDEAMPGGRNTGEKVQILQHVIDDQRQMLGQIVNPDVTRIPQLFCAYKEVLTLYQNGLQVPNDVTLCWADDNFGYIRQLSTPAEQKRAGGAGVYYHISYWGTPHDYLWQEGTQPALMAEELDKAYDYGTRTIWMLNVGGLKPREIDCDCFFQLAYDNKAWNVHNASSLLEDWAVRQFGPDHAKQIATLMAKYFTLSSIRRPEHMGFNLQYSKDTSQQKLHSADLPDLGEGEPLSTRLKQYAALMDDDAHLAAQMPDAQKDAYFELVSYKIQGAGLMNQKMLYADLADAARAHEAYDNIAALVAHYNTKIANGKWNKMIPVAPHEAAVFAMPPVAEGRPMLAEPIAESRGVLTQSHPAILAADQTFLRHSSTPDAGWQVIPGLGWHDAALAIFPTTLESADPSKLPLTSPCVVYRFTSQITGPVTASVYALPTHRTYPGRGARYAIAVDDSTPQVVDLESAEKSPQWEINVLRNAAVGQSRFTLVTSGEHMLRIWMIDPVVVLQQIEVSAER